jgi:glyoxylase-like metal-dependent hydrolase (beta-lactamase superfamily II)
VFEKVTENVFAIVGPPAYANVTAIILPESVVMVDSGIHLSAVVDTKKEIEDFSGRRIETVILTHFHSDHTRALPAFSQCRIISSQLLLKNLKQAGRKTPNGFTPTFPNETFKDQLEIQEGDIRLSIKRTGGHTDGSTCVYCPDHKVLVAGDNLWINYNPWGGARNGDPDAWIQALTEYLSLDAVYFVPGHGPVGRKSNVVELLNYIDSVREVMREMIASGRSEAEILKAGARVEYIPSRIVHLSTLKKWFKIWKARMD